VLTMDELAAPGERPAVDLDLHPLASEALARLARHWPALAQAAATD
jgi:hypothetical protein